MQDLITSSEAAAVARMNRERLVRRIQSGELAGQNIGGRWFVRRDSLDQFIKRQTALAR
jgi:excisionase family DNA binding protein